MATRYHQKRKIAGFYKPNQFLITLDPIFSFIVEDGSGGWSRNDEWLDVFAHEYWHNWHNISTLSGFKGFTFTQHAVAYFSQTLMAERDGRSRGSDELSILDRADLATLLPLQRVHDNEERPPGVGADTQARFHIRSLQEE